MDDCDRNRIIADAILLSGRNSGPTVRVVIERSANALLARYAHSTKTLMTSLKEDLQRVCVFLLILVQHTRKEGVSAGAGVLLVTIN